MSPRERIKLQQRRRRYALKADDEDVPRLDDEELSVSAEALATVPEPMRSLLVRSLNQTAALRKRLAQFTETTVSEAQSPRSRRSLGETGRCGIGAVFGNLMASNVTFGKSARVSLSPKSRRRRLKTDDARRLQEGREQSASTDGDALMDMMGALSGWTIRFTADSDRVVGIDDLRSGLGPDLMCGLYGSNPALEDWADLTQHSFTAIYSRPDHHIPDQVPIYSDDLSMLIWDGALANLTPERAAECHRTHTVTFPRAFADAENDPVRSREDYCAAESDRCERTTMSYSDRLHCTTSYHTVLCDTHGTMTTVVRYSEAGWDDPTREYCFGYSTYNTQAAASRACISEPTCTGISRRSCQGHVSHQDCTVECEGDWRLCSGRGRTPPTHENPYPCHIRYRGHDVREFDIVVTGVENCDLHVGQTILTRTEHAPTYTYECMDWSDEHGECRDSGPAGPPARAQSLGVLPWTDHEIVRDCVREASEVGNPYYAFRTESDGHEPVVSQSGGTHGSDFKGLTAAEITALDPHQSSCGICKEYEPSTSGVYISGSSIHYRCAVASQDCGWDTYGGISVNTDDRMEYLKYDDKIDTNEEISLGDLPELEQYLRYRAWGTGTPCDALDQSWGWANYGIVQTAEEATSSQHLEQLRSREQHWVGENLNWYGVRCSGQANHGGRVDGLRLSTSGAAGEMPMAPLVRLSALTSLHLGGLLQLRGDVSTLGVLPLNDVTLLNTALRGFCEGTTCRCSAPAIPGGRTISVEATSPGDCVLQISAMFEQIDEDHNSEADATELKQWYRRALDAETLTPAQSQLVDDALKQFLDVSPNEGIPEAHLETLVEMLRSRGRDANMTRAMLPGVCERSTRPCRPAHKYTFGENVRNDYDGSRWWIPCDGVTRYSDAIAGRQQLYCGTGYVGQWTNCHCNGLCDYSNFWASSRLTSDGSLPRTRGSADHLTEADLRCNDPERAQLQDYNESAAGLQYVGEPPFIIHGDYPYNDGYMVGRKVFPDGDFYAGPFDWARVEELENNLWDDYNWGECGAHGGPITLCVSSHATCVRPEIDVQFYNFSSASEVDLTIGRFSVSAVTCGAGSQGFAVAEPCKYDGGPYVLTGCTPCPAGTYLPAHLAAMNSSSCIDCPLNTYSGHIETTVTRTANPNVYTTQWTRSAAGASECLRCPSNGFTSLVGSPLDWCVACPNGTHYIPNKTDPALAGLALQELPQFIVSNPASGTSGDSRDIYNFPHEKTVTNSQGDKAVGELCASDFDCASGLCGEQRGLWPAHDSSIYYRNGHRNIRRTQYGEAQGREVFDPVFARVCNQRGIQTGFTCSENDECASGFCNKSASGYSRTSTWTQVSVGACQRMPRQTDVDEAICMIGRIDRDRCATSVCNGTHAACSDCIAKNTTQSCTNCCVHVDEHCCRDGCCRDTRPLVLVHQTYVGYCEICPYPEQCEGNVCAHGSTGRGCATCVQTTSPRWYRMGSKCLECPQTFPWLIVIGSITAFVLFGVLIWKIAGVPPADLMEKRLIKTALSARSSAGDVVTVSAFVTSAARFGLYLGIVLPHIQFFSVLAQIASVFPDAVREFARQFLAWCNLDLSSLIMSPECAVDAIDPQIIYLARFGIAHVAFLTFVAFFSVAKRSSRNHGENSIHAIYSISVIMLTKSCWHAIDCTKSEARTESGPKWHLDSWPDIECTSESAVFKLQVFCAIIGLVIYAGIVPARMFLALHRAGASGRSNDSDFRASHAWLLQKYRPGAWYAEFVFIGLRIVTSAASVMLDSQEHAGLCISVLVCATFATFAFVWLALPFDDGSAEPNELTDADFLQVTSLIFSLFGLMMAYVCYLRPDYDDDNSLVKMLVATAAAVPVFVGIHIESKARQRAEAAKKHRWIQLGAAGKTVGIDANENKSGTIVQIYSDMDVKLRWDDGSISSWMNADDLVEDPDRGIVTVEDAGSEPQSQQTMICCANPGSCLYETRRLRSKHAKPAECCNRYATPRYNCSHFLLTAFPLYVSYQLMTAMNADCQQVAAFAARDARTFIGEQNGTINRDECAFVVPWQPDASGFDDGTGTGTLTTTGGGFNYQESSGRIVNPRRVGDPDDLHRDCTLDPGWYSQVPSEARQGWLNINETTCNHATGTLCVFAACPTVVELQFIPHCDARMQCCQGSVDGTWRVDSTGDSAAGQACGVTRGVSHTVIITSGPRVWAKQSNGQWANNHGFWPIFISNVVEDLGMEPLKYMYADLVTALQISASVLLVTLLCCGTSSVGDQMPIYPVRTARPKHKRCTCLCGSGSCCAERGPTKSYWKARANPCSLVLVLLTIAVYARWWWTVSQGHEHLHVNTFLALNTIGVLFLCQCCCCGARDDDTEFSWEPTFWPVQTTSPGREACVHESNNLGDMLDDTLNVDENPIATSHSEPNYS